MAPEPSIPRLIESSESTLKIGTLTNSEFSETEPKMPHIGK